MHVVRQPDPTPDSALELHGANHHVFDSNSGEVIQAMRAFLARN
jgi:hypothetical protein